MPFASVADVKRILNLTDEDAARDARLRAALSAVESWAEQQQWNISDSGAQVESFFDVAEDATLYIPKDAIVTKVRVFSGSSPETARDLVLSTLSPGYELADGGKVILRPSLWVQPFEGAWASRFMRYHARVDVYYVGAGVVPKALTEGIAWLAAGYHTEGPTILLGIVSEKIGDYSYTLRSGSSGGEAGKSSSDPAFVRNAQFWLHPFMRTSRVSVT